MRAVHEALDLCLSCKACKTECPVQVDMAAYKAEFLAQHYKGRLHPLQHYVFGFADKLARLGSIAPGLTNAVLTGPLTSPLIKRIAGVARSANFRKLAAQSLPEQCAANAVRAERIRTEPADRTGASVAGYVEQLLPSANAGGGGDGAQRWRDFVWRRRKGISAADGRCTISDFWMHARAYLARVLDRMGPQIDAGMPFIFLEPSCASVFKDELLEFFPKDRRAQNLTRASLAAGRLAGGQGARIGCPSRLEGSAHPCARTLPSQGGVRRTGE